MYYLKSTSVSNYGTSNFCRVTSGAPCPICNHKDWCSVTEDGALAICMRQSVGSIKSAKNGGYVHIISDLEYRPKVRNALPQKQSSVAKNKAILAPVERRHLIYEELLSALTLSREHADDLERRGLSDTTIAREFYASMPNPSKLKSICDELAAKYDLNGVPGFYTNENNKWRLCNMKSGFFIPYRDASNKIQALQFRCDDNKPKYCWVSSSNKTNGVSSGAQIHIAQAWLSQTVEEVIVTEGGLKATVIAETLATIYDTPCCVIGVPGVSSFNDDFGYWLKSQISKLTHVKIAYDADWRINRTVKQALVKVARIMNDANLKTKVLTWNKEKGLDDYLQEES